MSDIEIKKSIISGEFDAPPIGRYGGDYSFAGMFFARAALDSSVICNNLNALSEQNGKVVLDILQKFGAKVTRSLNCVNVRSNQLRGGKFDISEFVKVAPAISLLALFASGKTQVSGFKQSPEIQGLIIENLTALGARCEHNSNDLWIWPQHSIEHSVLNAKNDPYMAMALILISTYTQGTTVVRNVDGLFNRYPEFLPVFEALGGSFRVCQIAL